MSKVMNIKELRKRLGIKKLKSKIPISEFEKAVIIGLRIREKEKMAHRIKQYA
jgi:hypothetical protein